MLSSEQPDGDGPVGEIQRDDRACHFLRPPRRVGHDDPRTFLQPAERFGSGGVAAGDRWLRPFK